MEKNPYNIHRSRRRKTIDSRSFLFFSLSMYLSMYIDRSIIDASDEKLNTQNAFINVRDRYTSEILVWIV